MKSSNRFKSVVITLGMPGSVCLGLWIAACSDATDPEKDQVPLTTASTTASPSAAAPPATSMPAVATSAPMLMATSAAPAVMTSAPLPSMSLAPPPSASMPTPSASQEPSASATMPSATAPASASAAEPMTSGSAMASASASSTMEVPSGEFALTSPVHEDGAAFADKYTCKATGQFNGSLSPEMNWTDGPSGTMSYVLVFTDTTILGKNATDSKGFHWAIWNIPASTHTLPEELAQNLTMVEGLETAKQNSRFLGPCPNVGAAAGATLVTDEYALTLYAVPTETLNVAANASVMAVRDAVEGVALATAVLTGTSDAKGGF